MGGQLGKTTSRQAEGRAGSHACNHVGEAVRQSECKQAKWAGRRAVKLNEWKRRWTGAGQVSRAHSIALLIDKSNGWDSELTHRGESSQAGKAERQVDRQPGRRADGWAYRQSE